LGISTNYQLPWPEATDQADGPLGIGNLARRTDDVLLTNIYNPLSSRISTLESVPPVVVPRMVRGRVTGASGVIQAGTGFSAQRTAPGQYTITFSAAFPTTPALLATVTDSSDRRITVRTIGAASFGVNTRDANGALVDCDFNFLAVAM
jgi:hypothetical protein